MKKTKELTIFIYDNFERKKVFLIKKTYIKYILLSISLVFFGFIVFFMFFLNSKIENKTEEKIDFSNQINSNNTKEINQSLIQSIDASNNLDNNYLIENIVISKNNFSFNLKNLNSNNNLSGYLVLLFRTNNTIYSYPDAISVDSNKISIDYYKGEEFLLKQNKIFNFKIPILVKENFNSVLIYIYSNNGVLTYSKSFELGAFYE